MLFFRGEEIESNGWGEGKRTGARIFSALSYGLVDRGVSVGMKYRCIVGNLGDAADFERKREEVAVSSGSF